MLFNASPPFLRKLCQFLEKGDAVSNCSQTFEIRLDVLGKSGFLKSKPKFGSPDDALFEFFNIPRDVSRYADSAQSLNGLP